MKTNRFPNALSTKGSREGFQQRDKKEFILNKDYKNNLLSKMM